MLQKKSEIQFADKKLKDAFERLDNVELKKFIERALQDIQSNPFCGVQIPKKLIPQDYIKKFNIRNVWKYNLPNAWRLIYSIEGGQTIILTIIVEWMDHKEYERRFHY